MRAISGTIDDGREVCVACGRPTEPRTVAILFESDRERWYHHDCLVEETQELPHSR